MADKTRRIWEYILETCEARNGVTPTVSEIMESCGISSSSVVNYHIEKLVAAGKIAKGERPSRWYVAGATWKAPVY